MTHAAKEAGTSKDRGFHNTRPPSPRLRRTGMGAEKGLFPRYLGHSASFSGQFRIRLWRAALCAET
jgi:hypothetical protein